MKKLYHVIIFISLVTLSFLVTGCDTTSPASNSDADEIQRQQELVDEIQKSPGYYLVGTGMYDVTGPAAEVTMGGYAVDDQKTAGIQLRLRSRAFIVGDAAKRVVFVSVDTWAMTQAVKQEISRRVATDPVLKDYYSGKNICISATHTHNSVAGFSHYFLYNVPNKGFIKDSFDAIADGIYQSIKRAHANLSVGSVFVNEGSLTNAGWNRSLFAYNNNPSEERAHYGKTTDTSMVLLKFVTREGEEIGMLNWYAVHPDCIGPENKLISGDTKGHASYNFEKEKGTDYTKSRTFVAAFAQANSGDVTPNVPFTEYLGSIEWAMEVLGIERATAEKYGFPWPQALGEADIEKNPVLKYITKKQVDEARKLYSEATVPVTGSIDFRHEHVDMRTLYVADEGCTTCAGGMGASYSFGSPADNPTPFPLFGVGVTTDSLEWSEDARSTFLKLLLGSIVGLIWPDSLGDEYEACHEPKPVILPTGEIGLNFKDIPMTPQILPVQLLKIGNVAIVAQPTEVTTMAGRRLKETVRNTLASEGVEYVTLAGLSNAYASYMATKEEYAMQSYAGAGTFFGPNQVLAFQQEFKKLAEAIVQRTDVPEGPEPPDLREDQVNLTTGVVLDDKPLSVDFGDVKTEPAEKYTKGETVKAVFWGGHPRNNLRLNDTFLVVEKIDGNKTVIVARDWDPETRYRWQRESVSYSLITIEWNTCNAEPGIYRITHYGDWKSGWTGKISPYSGTTRTFVVE